jgi:UDP-GlcNAc:undecaprenyl-phosphate GlcNAc-1-phosphate transferase
MFTDLTALYFPPFAKALTGALVLSGIFIAGGKYFLKDKKVLRLGGVAMVSAFLFALVSDYHLVISPQLIIIIGGVAAIVFFGFVDDYLNLSWKVQFIFQLIIITAVVLLGVKIAYISNPFTEEMLFFDTGILAVIGVLISIVWIMAVINAMNWLDGVDGLSAGVTFFGGIIIFLLSLKPEVNQPPVGIIAIALSGAMLGFLFFNFNPAKIMAGTVGSFFMGFSLATVAIFAGAKIATTLLVLLLPILDFFWVIGERFRAGTSIFQGGDKRHLHHKLQQLGWSELKIALLVYAFTGIIGLVALFTKGGEKIAVIIIIVGLMFAFYNWVDKKINRHQHGF